jgi:hypothetical protein
VFYGGNTRENDMTPIPTGGFTYKWAYRSALSRARLALTWEDRLDALAQAEKMRRRILADKGRYRLSVQDYSMAAVRASAFRTDIRRVMG